MDNLIGVRESEEAAQVVRLLREDQIKPDVMGLIKDDCNIYYCFNGGEATICIKSKDVLMARDILKPGEEY